MLDALPPLPEGIEANDPNDAFLLVMALAGKADCLITGDRRSGLLQRGGVGRYAAEGAISGRSHSPKNSTYTRMCLI